MSEYKRLTGQKWTDDIDLTKEYGYSHIYKRLYEIENKIENGLFIELPCKLGNTVYYIEYFCNYKGCSPNEQSFCCGCQEMIERERKGEIYIIRQKKFELKDLDKINKTFFITKSEAEAKLKRLKEKTN